MNLKPSCSAHSPTTSATIIATCAITISSQRTRSSLRKARAIRHSIFAKNVPNPSCRVVREEDDGVVVAGMKMLATSAPLADEIWIGNILPLAPEAKAEFITFAVPCNAQGLSLWSRKPIAPSAQSELRCAARAGGSTSPTRW